MLDDTQKHPRTPRFDDKLLEIVQGSVQTSSRAGIYLTLVALIIIFLLLGMTAIFMQDESKTLEKELQVSATQNVARQIERRLLMISQDVLQLAPVTSKSLTVISANEFCQNIHWLFNKYPEIINWTVSTEQGMVLGDCSTDSPLSVPPHPTLASIKQQETLFAINRALHLNVQNYSEPYTLPGTSEVFVDLITPWENRAFSARIALTPLANSFLEQFHNRQYLSTWLVNGKPFPDGTSLPDRINIADETVIATITPLPGNVSFMSIRTPSSSKPTYLKLASSLFFLPLLPILAVLVVLRYQYQQMRTEQILRARTIVQEAISQTMSDGLCILSPTGKILYVNEAFEKLFGFESGQAVDLEPPFEFCLNPEIFSFFATDSNSLIDWEHRSFDFYALNLKTRQHFDCQVEILPLASPKADGSYAGWLLTARDITKQKRAHLAQQVMHNRMVRVMDTLETCLSVIDPEDHTDALLYSNTNYLQRFGHDKSAHNRLKAALKGQTSGEVFDKPTQSWFSVTIKPFDWVDGQHVEGLSAIDVTSRKKNEELLEMQIKKSEQTQKLISMGEMASSMAHELNQPLAAISNYSSVAKMMVESPNANPATIAEALDRINKQSQRAAQIIRRIRSFARRSEFLPKTVTIDKLIQESLELANLQAQKLSMTVEVQASDRTKTLLCDEVLIVQVLVNLMKNAMEASIDTHAHSVMLKVHQEGNMIHFDVIDHGTGISQAHLPHIFDPFFSTKKTGMGIGLNICRSIVENHHGRLYVVESSKMGTIFRMSLPITKVSEESDQH